MISLEKSYDFFKPESCKERIHILGCGAVGATIAENLARFGLTKITLWDFDIVEGKNVHNQIFFAEHIGKPKVEALRDILVRINPDIVDGLILKPEGWKGENLSGIVFLAVDNIELRMKIAAQHKDNMMVKAMFDVRNLLTETQLYFANWSDYKMKQDFIKSMDFKHDEVGENERVSACGTTLGVAVTSRVAAAYTAANFINFIKGEPTKKMMIINIFEPDIVAF